MSDRSVLFFHPVDTVLSGDNSVSLQNTFGELALS